MGTSVGETVGALLGEAEAAGEGAGGVPAMSSVAVPYVGTSVGATVGALLGEAEGCGVGLLAV